MAADLSGAGHEVRIYDLPEFAWSIKPIVEKGGIDLIVKDNLGEEQVAAAGTKSGFVRVSKATTDVEEAVRGVEVILIVVPSFGQMTFVQKIAPHLEDGQVILFQPGNFASLEAFRMLKGKDVILADAESMIYASRITKPGGVWIKESKRSLKVAALPAAKTPEVLSKVRVLYPQIEAAQNILDTGIHNINFINHPASVVMNVVNIENLGAYEYSAYDVTPAMGRVMEAVDQERMSVAQAFQVKPEPAKEILKRFYGAQGNNIYEALRDCRAYKVMKAPKDTKDRYVSEDIPYGYVPLSELGQKAGVKTSTIDGMIALASAMNATDYRSTGRRLDRLGIAEMSVQDIVKYVNEGG